MRTNLKKTFGYRFPLTRKLINFERIYQMVILTESEIAYLNTQQLISLTLTLLNSSFFRAWFSKHSHRLFDLLHSQLENIYEKKMIFRNTFFSSWFHFTELTAAFRKSKSSTIKIRAIAYWYNVCIFVDKIRLLINKKKLMLFRFQITTAIVTVYWNLDFFFEAITCIHKVFYIFWRNKKCPQSRRQNSRSLSKMKYPILLCNLSFYMPIHRWQQNTSHACPIHCYF